MLYHCTACPDGPCHALNANSGTGSRAARLHKGLCAQGHRYHWVECNCKADTEEDGRIDGCPDRITIAPEGLAVFQALLGGE